MALALVSPPPAWVSTASGSNITTAAFTPPAGALLLAQSMFDTSTTTRTETTTTVTGSTSAWTKIQHQNAGLGLVDSNWATVTSAVSTTVRSTWVTATNDGALSVFVVTGQHATTPIGQSGKGVAAADGSITVTVTPTTPGSLVFVSYAQFNGAGVPTSGQLTTYGSASPSGTFGSYYSAPLTGATTITLTGGLSGGAYNWVEVLPAVGSGATGSAALTGAGSLTRSGKPAASRTTTLAGSGTVTASGSAGGVPPQNTQPVEAGKVLWGMGDNIDGAEGKSMFTDADTPMRMVTTWYNGTGDLGWISGYTQPSTMSDYAKRGYAQHLVVWLADDPAYAITPQFQTDLATLVTAMKGDGPERSPLYVTLFTEFETYSSDPAYFTQLHAAYMAAVDVVHNTAPQAYVSLGFGGYTWGGKTTADLSQWADAIAKSDFASVQAMQACDNTSGPNGTNEIVQNLRNSVAQLGSMGKPVMVSHFLIWGDGACPITAFQQARDDLLSPSSLASLTSKGLFAWDMMNGGGAAYLDVSTAGSDYATTKSMMNAVRSTGIDLPAGSTPTTGVSVSDTAFTYTGAWNTVASPSEHWTSAAGATARINFTAGAGGTTFTLRGAFDITNNTATVSIDGGTPATVSETGNTALGQPVWTSPTIPAGNHTATVTVTSPDFSIMGADISNGTFGGPGSSSSTAAVSGSGALSATTGKPGASRTTALAGSGALSATQPGAAATLLRVGGLTPSAVRLGTAPVDRLYLGSTLVWGTAPAGATSGSAPALGSASALPYAAAARTSSAVPVPTGVAVNDVVLVHFYTEDSTPTITAPTGFTELTFTTAPVTTGQVMRQRVFWKRAAGADTGSYTFTHASAITEAVAGRYTGCVTSGTPVEVLGSSVTSTSSATVTPVSGTTTGSNELLVWGLGHYIASAGPQTPAGFTVAADGSDLLVCYKTQTAAGGTGTITDTFTGSSNSGVTLLGLLPA